MIKSGQEPVWPISPMAALGRNQMGTLIVFQSSCINAKKSRIENLSGHDSADRLTSDIEPRMPMHALKAIEQAFPGRVKRMQRETMVWDWVFCSAPGEV